MDVYGSTKTNDPAALLRLKQVLQLVPVCASTWWAGVRSGRFPRPIKLGPRITCWRAYDVLALVNSAPTGAAKRAHMNHASTMARSSGEDYARNNSESDS